MDVRDVDGDLICLHKKTPAETRTSDFISFLFVFYLDTKVLLMHLKYDQIKWNYTGVSVTLDTTDKLPLLCT